MSKSNSSRNILLQVTGSIAAFKAVALCSKLVQLGHTVEVVLSEGALEFVGAASFEGLTRRKVHTGIYEEGRMMAHIDLERWADVVLLYPASANTIAKLATGQADSLISTLFLAHEFKKPYFIAPAMNQAMFAHPAMQAHLKTLNGYGIQILSPNDGFLACGEIGAGRLIEPEQILEVMDKLPAPASRSFEKQSAPLPTRKKILITSGGTSEPIDPVRSITNFSTGETGYRLAKTLRMAGHEVTLIQSRASHFREPSQISYTSTNEFVDAVKSQLQTHDFDFMIHAAAVADYRVENISTQKIQSDGALTLKLVPNEKVISHVRGWSRHKGLKLISFKLTSDSDPKLASYDSEWIIHNELKNVSGEAHAGTIFNFDREPQFKFQTKTELATLVQSIIENREATSVKGKSL